MNPITADIDPVPQGKNIHWEGNQKSRFMAYFMFFGLLWIVAWMKYTSRFITIVSAMSYYFNSDATHEGSAEVCLGFTFAYWYHIGSVLMGSFIIAVVWFIKCAFLYLAKALGKFGGDNRVSKALLACGTCLLSCIERIVDYINIAGFCYVAVSGDSFCSSCWSAFLLNLKHCSKFAFANFLAKLFILLGKLAICTGNVFSLLAIMKMRGDMDEVTSTAGPIVVTTIVTYMTATIFLGVFDTSVMAILTCLALDMDLHGGVPIKGPPTFHDEKASFKKMQRTVVVHHYYEGGAT